MAELVFDSFKVEYSGIDDSDILNVYLLDEKYDYQNILCMEKEEWEVFKKKIDLLIQMEDLC